MAFHFRPSPYNPYAWDEQAEGNKPYNELGGWQTALRVCHVSFACLGAICGLTFLFMVLKKTTRLLAPYRRMLLMSSASDLLFCAADMVTQCVS